MSRKVPLSQFVQKRQVSLSSNAVTLSQSGRTEQSQIIKNRYSVAIGEVIGAGVMFDTNRTILRAQTCYNFPEVHFLTLHMSIIIVLIIFWR